VVEKGERCGLRREREGGREGRGESESEKLTARWKWIDGLTLGEIIFPERCWIPFNCSSVETECWDCKDWKFRWFSQTFRGSEPPKISSELPKLEFQRQLTFTPFEILNLLPTDIPGHGTLALSG
jgi:hypothetical protein